MKTLSIIGIVLASISFVCLVCFNTSYNYEAGIGWGMYAALYLLAMSITLLVKNKNYKKVNKK